MGVLPLIITIATEAPMIREAVQSIIDLFRSKGIPVVIQVQQIKVEALSDAQQTQEMIAAWRSQHDPK